MGVGKDFDSQFELEGWERFFEFGICSLKVDISNLDLESELESEIEFGFVLEVAFERGNGKFFCF